MKTTSHETSPTSATEHSPDRYLLALGALLAAGLLLGVTTNLAKVSYDVGMAPLPYLTWSMLGAALILLAGTLYRGSIAELNRRSLEYFLVAGFLTTAGANLIFFNAIPRLGVSFVAMTIALPPLITYLGALLLRMEGFCWWRAGGVLLAMTGTILLVAKRWSGPGDELFWIALTLLAPVLLALGNLYRSHRWPPGANAQSLAPGTIIAGTFLLLAYALVSGESLTVGRNGVQATLLIAIQAVVFAGQFFLLFVLQKAGGPVFMSLMGGVSAVFGVPIAVGILNEPLTPGFLASAAFVAGGVACLMVGAKACVSNVAGRKSSARQ